MTEEVIYYRGTDFNLTISGITGLSMSLATQIKAILRKDGLSDIEFSLSGGAITVLSATSLDLRIEDGLITVPGIYQMLMTATVSGSIRPLTPKPDWIKVI